MKKIYRMFYLILSLIILLPFPGFGHHGKEFLVVSTYTTPEQGKFYFLSSINRVSIGPHRELEFEPGLLYGLTNRWSVEFHTHHGFENNIFRTESIGLETRYRIFGSLDPEGGHHQVLEPSTFSLATLFEWEKAIQDAPDRLEGRLILGGERDRFSIVANGIGHYVITEGNPIELRYGFGIKYNLTPVLSAGVELDGNSFQPTITPGIYGSLAGKLEFRFGASFETYHLNKDITLLSTFIYPL